MKKSGMGKITGSLGAYGLPNSLGHAVIDNVPYQAGNQVAAAKSAGKTPYAKTTGRNDGARHMNGGVPAGAAGGKKVWTPGNGTGPTRYSGGGGKMGKVKSTAQ